jgi:TonB family protein
VGRLASQDVLAISLASTILLHVGFAFGLDLADKWRVRQKPKEAMKVEFDLSKQPPPPPPLVEPPPPPPPKAEEPPPPQPKQKKLAKIVDEPLTPPPPVPPEAEPPPPAPGPPSDEPPADEYVYKMPSGGTEGTMGVRQGARPTGRTGGVRGGTGTGTGGGGDEGTGPKTVSIAAVKDQPVPIGEYDYMKDYPKAAQRDLIQGQVLVRILVDDDGGVKRAKLLRGLRKDVDDFALEIARKLKFKPARDTAGDAVAVEITWKFTFVLPDES